MNKKKLSLEEKFGQMILLGLDTYDINDEIIDIIKNYHIGGVVLYKKNYTSIDTMINFINKLKDINKDGIPLFISIDQENGRVNRLPNDIERIKSAYKQACTKNLEIINEVNKITCYLLKSVGVNMNFAPVLDILRDEKNKVIGNRSYGNNAADIIKYGFPFMNEMKKNNIISVVKHFPGHGLTSDDSHLVLPRIKNLNEMNNIDSKIFESAIKNGADAIMVGHLLIKGYGLDPASINEKIISKYLVDKYKYNGLIITDDVRMGSLRFFRRTKNTIKKAVKAGNNIIMIKYKKGDSKLLQKLNKMVKDCEFDPLVINNNFNKILDYKEKYKLNNNLVNPKLDIEKINKIIKKLNQMIDGDLIEK